MYHTFNFIDHIDEYVYDDKYVYLSLAGCRLRKHDSNLDYDPFGLYETSIVELPNISGLAIREFTGVYVEALIPDGTSLQYQASTDNGATWQWYNGAIWQTAGPTDWSTITQLDEGITLLGGRQLKIRVQLVTNTDQDETPQMARIHVFYEAVWGFFEDLKRSIKSFIDSNLICHLTWAREATSATSSISLDTAWPVLGVDSVYDITADPGRITNIFQSYTPGNPGTITLSSSVASGNVVEVHFRGRCEVFLAADENLQISVVPAVVVVLTRAREDRYASKNLFEYEPLISKDVVRRRERVIPILSTIMIHAIGSIEVDSLAIQDGIAEIFEPEPSFTSQAVGDDFFCLTFEPLIDDDMVSTGLHVKTIQISVLGNKDLRSFTDVPPVTVIETELVGAGAVSNPGDLVPVSSVVVPNDEQTRSNKYCDIMLSEKGEIDE